MTDVGVVRATWLAAVTAGWATVGAGVWGHRHTSTQEQGRLQHQLEHGHILGHQGLEEESLQDRSPLSLVRPAWAFALQSGLVDSTGQGRQAMTPPR